MDPLDQWTGAFGDDYATRNEPTERMLTERVEGFRRCLPAVDSVLEVGANIGINMRALRHLWPDMKLGAVEPNDTARTVLAEHADTVYAGDAYNIPVDDGSYDLAFTAGVLIHIPPARLPDAMAEIARTTRRYVLCIEYFSHTPQEVAYRGNAGMLWKQDFGRAWLATIPGLRCVTYGFLWEAEFPEGWDDVNWWLFEKDH